MTARLKKAIKRILYLHCCEQEGIDMPTPKLWMEGVDELSEAFEEAKYQSEPESKGPLPDISLIKEAVKCAGITSNDVEIVYMSIKNIGNLK